MVCLVSSGQLAPGDFTDAQLRATQAAILEQEIAGIDVITGGEMHRATHNRHRAAICRGPILDSIDLGLVEEFMTVSSFARRPVKVTMTGPHLLAAVAYDEFYNDTASMMSDFGKLLRCNFRQL